MKIQNNTPTLETERLILRKFTEKDMEALFLILKEYDFLILIQLALMYKLNQLLETIDIVMELLF